MEVRFSGSAVYRATFLDVDRGTVYLPVPLSSTAAGPLQVRQWESQLISLVNRLAGLDQYDSFCSSLGLMPVPGHPLD